MGLEERVHNHASEGHALRRVLAFIFAEAQAEGTWRGYLFLRNFGNLETCLKIIENFGSLPKFSDNSEEFTGWLSSEDNHGLVL